MPNLREQMSTQSKRKLSPKPKVVENNKERSPSPIGLFGQIKSFLHEPKPSENTFSDVTINSDQSVLSTNLTSLPSERFNPNYVLPYDDEANSYNELPTQPAQEVQLLHLNETSGFITIPAENMNNSLMKNFEAPVKMSLFQQMKNLFQQQESKQKSMNAGNTTTQKTNQKPALRQSSKPQDVTKHVQWEKMSNMSSEPGGMNNKVFYNFETNNEVGLAINNSKNPNFTLKDKIPLSETETVQFDFHDENLAQTETYKINSNNPKVGPQPASLMNQMTPLTQPQVPPFVFNDAKVQNFRKSQNPTNPRNLPRRNSGSRRSGGRRQNQPSSSYNRSHSHQLRPQSQSSYTPSQSSYGTIQSRSYSNQGFSQSEDSTESGLNRSPELSLEENYLNSITRSFNSLSANTQVTQRAVDQVSNFENSKNGKYDLSGGMDNTGETKLHHPNPTHANKEDNLKPRFRRRNDTESSLEISKTSEIISVDSELEPTGLMKFIFR